MTINDYQELDRAHLVHPVSSFREHERQGVRMLRSGHGMMLRDGEGHELLDAFAGLWCVNIGYGQQSVVEAATRQMSELPYATGYFHFGCEPAIRLAARLAELSPAGLDHVYFCLGGSDAVDSAIRYIVHYFNATGRPDKKQFIALERGYHGSSSTGAGLTALPAFHRNFDLPGAWQHHIASPYPYRNGLDGPEALIAASVRSLHDKVAELGGPARVAAFFCEPVQGSGGVIVPPKGWLKAMSEACRAMEILFVADEVITGFGRTGPLFACETEGVAPDLMTLAKGLTSGYVPMGAVLMSDRIYQGIADGADASLPIGHGATYSAHPVSAAVGLEVLRLYLEGGILANGQRTAGPFHAGLDGLREHPMVGDVRYAGLLAGIELVADKRARTRFDPSLNLAERLFRRGYDNRVIFRSFADGTIGLAPALVCTADEAHEIVRRVRLSLDQMLEEPDIRGALAG